MLIYKVSETLEVSRRTRRNSVSILKDIEKTLQSDKGLMVVQTTVPSELDRKPGGIYRHDVGFAVAPLDLSIMSDGLGVYTVDDLEAVMMSLLPKGLMDKVTGTSPFRTEMGNLYFGQMVVDEVIGKATTVESLSLDVDDVVLPGWGAVATTDKSGRSVQKETSVDVLRRITVVIYPDMSIAKWAIRVASAGISLKDLQRHMRGLTKTGSFRKI